jgi:ribose/xylose/arabinose/galactoside ABC-type transport system permease subunit
MTTANPLAPSVPSPASAPRREEPVFTRNRILSSARILVIVMTFVLLAVFVPSFFTERNLVNVLVQASSLGLMAIGMSVVMIGGGMDLSIPSVMALSAILGAMYLRDGGSLAVSLLIMMVVGVAAGCINGYAVAYLRMIPFVVTLAMMTVISGLAIWITYSVSVPVMDETFFDLILTRIAGVPRPIIILVIATFIMTIMMRRGIFGRWLYAVGTNVRAARVSGIPAQRVVFLTYVTSGLFAGLTAILLSARLGSASANIGNDGVVLDIISAVVVGGVSIYGGLGGPLGAVLGAIFITAISNSMNMLQVSFFAGLVVKGIVIIVFVAFDSLKRR